MAMNTDLLRSPEVKPAMQSSPSSSTQPSDPNYTESEKSTKTERVYRFFAYTESDSETEDEDEDDDEHDQSSSNDFPFWPRSKPLSFVYNECIAAIQGNAVPASIDSAMTCHSIVRGIRCHQEFTNSPYMVELCSRTKSDYPELTRARNARLIMSNAIPDEMDDPRYQPYSIWYLEIAREDIYRELAERYSSMHYQVGRACIAAGYVDLYKELCLLPDISIAEEARESDTPGSNEIF